MSALTHVAAFVVGSWFGVMAMALLVAGRDD
jgi:hypothetical protein